DLLQGVNPDKIAAASKTAGTALQKYRDYIQSDHVSWCVIAAPSPEWAAKVFPDLPREQQLHKLWEAIFDATRASFEDPVRAWQKHHEQLEQKVNYLNQKHYKTLHYEAPGTRLSIDLPEKHVWVGGGSNNQQGTPFV